MKRYGDENNCLSCCQGLGVRATTDDELEDEEIIACIWGWGQLNMAVMVWAGDNCLLYRNEDSCLLCYQVESKGWGPLWMPMCRIENSSLPCAQGVGKEG